MICVYKYPIPIEDEFTVKMPAGAEVLHVAVQNGAPFIWAKVDTAEVIVGHRFVLCGTGHSLDGRLKLGLDGRLKLGTKFVGTFFMGHAVFHLWKNP